MGKKNYKKIILLSGIGIGVIALVVGIVVVVKKTNADPVKVYPMSSLNQGYWGDNVTMDGMVSTDVSQDVFISADQPIKEVMVKEGDAVKEGDILVNLDTTVSELELETEKLNKQTIELKISAMEKNIVKLKKEKVTRSNATGNSGRITNLATMDGTIHGLDGNAKPYVGNGTKENPFRFRITNGAKIFGSFFKSMKTSYFHLDIYSLDNKEIIKQTQLIDGSKLEVVEDNKEVTNQITFVMKAYGVLDFDSIAYRGNGSAKDPFSFIVTEDVEIMGSFLNKMAGYDNTDGVGEKKTPFYFQVEIHKDDISTGNLITAIFKDGNVLNKFTATKRYKVENNGFVEVVENNDPTPTPPEVPENPGEDPAPPQDPNLPEEPQDPTDPEVPGGDMIPGDTPGEPPTDQPTEVPDVDPSVMSKEEREAAIKEQEANLKTAKLDLKQSELKVAKVQKKVADATVKAKISGIVQKVGKPEELSTSEPFVKVSNTEGFYIKGNISEFMLDKMKEGQSLMGTATESGAVFNATIKEVSPYPATGNGYGGMGNPNASYYPFVALVEVGEGLELKNYEYVQLNTTLGEDMNSDAIYVEKGFIKKEDGKSYVWKSASGKLEKQEVTTGKVVWGTAVEVTSGLSLEDSIAFPYGKQIKSGAKTKEGTMEELYGGM